MSLLPVVTLDQKNPILHSPTRLVENFDDPTLAPLITDMIETMYAKDGIGLAAPQINSSLRITVIVPNPSQFEKYKQATKKEALVLINPEITRHSLFKEKGEEGCLSIPGIFGIVKRWQEVTVTYRDPAGRPQIMKAKGLMARVVQHELDHLDGILFIDRADKLYQTAPETPTK